MEKKSPYKMKRKEKKFVEEGKKGRGREILWQQQLMILPVLKYEK